MFAKMIAEGPYHFPSFDLKKFLRRLKKTEPMSHSDGRVKPMAWIRRKSEQFPEAAVYRLPDGRIFCATVDVKENKIDVEGARHLLGPSASLFYITNASNTHLPSELGPKGEKADYEVQKWLAIAWHGYYEAVRVFAASLF